MILDMVFRRQTGWTLWHQWIIQNQSNVMVLLKCRINNKTWNSVCNRGERGRTMAHYCTFMPTTDNTIQYHGRLHTRKLGQAPILLFLTLRQALSSHPHQQMVWLCRLQDRDSIHIQYTINHPTTLHTQWNPVSHCCLPKTLLWLINASQNSNPSKVKLRGIRRLV